MSDKQRIIDLQAQLRVARKALEAIKNGYRCPERMAEDALYEMMGKDSPVMRAPLAGVLGRERTRV